MTNDDAIKQKKTYRRFVPENKTNKIIDALKLLYPDEIRDGVLGYLVPCTIYHPKAELYDFKPKSADEIAKIQSGDSIVWCYCDYGESDNPIYGKYFCDECGGAIECSVCCEDDELKPEEIKQTEIDYFGIYVCEKHKEIAIYVVADRRD